MLAIYRDIKQNQEDFAALHEHLKSCMTCRATFAQQKFLGDSLRALPAIEPDPTAHHKLMQALAAEHVRYMQQAPNVAASPPPGFLKPYLAQQNTSQTEPLTTLSTASTGPLLITQTSRRRSRLHPMSHVAVLGIAAAFLMAVMLGGLTSLLILTHNGLPGTGDTAASINNFVQVSRSSYTTTTAYNHVASAIANHDTVYYTAHGDGSTGWMLEKFDTKANFSIPLLSQESTTPLIVLASNQNWLTWLQLGADKPVTIKHGSQQSKSQVRTWSLYALNLDSSAQAAGSAPKPITLLKDTFNQSTAPAWINNPVQGVAFAQNTLFVTSIDSKGNSHLQSFQLDQQKIQPTQIATAPNGHILTSPSASSDRSKIFWSEEWQTDDQVLHSNIWTQQKTQMAPATPGRWAAHTQTNTFLYRTDGASFHPQYVNDTLFFLSTDPAAATNETSATGTATATAPAQSTAVPSATAQATSTPSTAVTTNADPTILAQSPDANIQGTLLAITSGATQPTVMDTSGQDTVPQGGTRFLLWQNSAKGLEMYDAVTASPVTVKNIVPNGTTFLTVNGETAIWIANPNTDGNTPASSAQPSVTFSSFSWPSKTQGGQ